MAETNEQKIEEVLSRGVSEVIVGGDLKKKLESGKKLRLYFGVDPTGAQLHLGHAVVLRKLKEFADLGHDVILLIGDFTAKIGDPTGRDAMRVPLSDKQIKENFKDYKKQASKILDFSKVKIMQNSKWLSKLSFEEILKLSSQFTVQQMLHREMFRRRLNFILGCPQCGREVLFPAKEMENKKGFESITSGIVLVKWECDQCGYGKKEGEDKWDRKNIPGPVGVNEFLYPLMQGYDSVALDVDLEIGGNDQLFNMLIGRDLQKIYSEKDKDVMGLKLLLGTDGRKMSKTYDNAIYLNDNPDMMFGKIMSIKDELIGDYFELCTYLDKANIAEILQMPNPRDQKVVLAKEIVNIYRGTMNAHKVGDLAAENFDKVFRQKEPPSEIEPFETDKKVYPILDLLCDSNLAESKNDGKRLIEGGGVSVSLGKSIPFEKINDWKQEIELKNEMIIQVGKRRFVKIKIK